MQSNGLILFIRTRLLCALIVAIFSVYGLSLRAEGLTLVESRSYKLRTEGG